MWRLQIMNDYRAVEQVFMMATLYPFKVVMTGKLKDE